MQRQNFVIRWGDLCFYRGKWFGAARRALYSAKRANPEIADKLKIEIERAQGRVVRTQTFKADRVEFLKVGEVVTRHHGLLKNRS